MTTVFADRLTAPIHKPYMNMTINVQFELLTFMTDIDARANIRGWCVLPMCLSCPLIHSRQIQQIPISVSEKRNKLVSVCVFATGNKQT